MSEEFRLTSPKEVRALLEKLGHRPNKGLGQNYLIDANILDIIANTAEIGPDESVLEIGPGLGALTERIIPKAKSVTCIEKDPTMVKYIKERFASGGTPSSAWLCSVNLLRHLRLLCQPSYNEPDFGY